MRVSVSMLNSTASLILIQEENVREDTEINGNLLAVQYVLWLATCIMVYYNLTVLAENQLRKLGISCYKHVEFKL